MPGWDFQNVAVGRINEVAVLTGFSNEKMYGRFAGQKKLLAVITWWSFSTKHILTYRIFSI